MGLAAAASVVAAIVLGSVLGQGPDTPSQEGSQSLTDAEWIACSPGIGLGQITRVAPSSEPDQVRLSLSVTEWLKSPEPVRDSITFEAMSAAFTDDPPFEPGQTILVVLHEPRRERAEVFRADNPKRGQDAEQVRRLVERNLAEARDTSCPGRSGEGSRDDQ